MKLLAVFIVLIFGIISSASNSGFQKPDHFPEPSYDFVSNPMERRITELGQFLFYDPILSLDNSISCASCHSPYNAFAHTDHKLSHGIGDSIGRRNAPPLFNLAWHNTFQWDGGINHLDMQPLAPITDPKEMGEKLDNIIEKLNNSELYKKKFKSAFGEKASTKNLLLALSQFELTLVSANSKYDKHKLGEVELSQQELKGETLFKEHCNTCHTAPLFTSLSFENNGLPVDSALLDLGKYEISRNSEDSLKFKIPSLRNLAYTKPYMHDGRFQNLRQVLNHYTDGITPSATLSKTLTNNINLTSEEKTDLIAFLLTLNDKEFVFNPTNQFPKELIKYIYK